MFMKAVNLGSYFNLIIHYLCDIGSLLASLDPIYTIIYKTETCNCCKNNMQIISCLFKYLGKCI